MAHKITIIVDEVEKFPITKFSTDDEDELRYQIEDLLLYWNLKSESLTIEPLGDI